MNARRLVTLPLDAMTTANAVITAYIGLLTIVASRATTPRTGAENTAPTRFVVLVPAHDEAAVIGDTLCALCDSDYPADRFSVHVVADNCSDHTAAIARRHGCTVHVRNDAVRPGKGPALNWALDRIDHHDLPDVVVIVDADTVVDRDFLRAMDRVFARGAHVAQGFYTVRNPTQSPGTAFRYAALACRHHIRPLARNRLGCSAGLYGNGMAFRTEILQRHPWTGHLVEDAELQIKLLLDEDIRVTYVPDARVAAEMPDNIDGATSQNERWERGRIELACTSIPRLLTELRTRRRSLAHLDAIADQLVPPMSVLAASLVISTLASVPTVMFDRRSGGTRVVLNLIASATLVSHAIIGLRSVAAPKGVYRHIAGVPALTAWKTRLWLSSLRPGKEVAWQRTRRNAR